MRTKLFERYKSLHRQKLKIEDELESIERQITDERHERDTAVIASSPPQSTTSPKPKAATRPRAKPKASGAKGQLSRVTQEMARKTITAIRDAGAGQPVTRRDVSAKLGLSDYATTYRLQRLQTLGFVERVGNQLYRVVDIVPAL